MCAVGRSRDLCLARTVREWAGLRRAWEARLQNRGLQVRFLPGLFFDSVQLGGCLWVLKSLLDLLVAVAWACWHRLRASQEEYRARALEHQRPVLRLETRRVKRFPTVVAVLVSLPEMEHRVRRALGGRATLRFASTWAELQQVVAHMAPSAIIADPAADWGGDPEQHLASFSDEWRLPVILYTTLTPHIAGVLLRLGAHRISHVIFHRLDDAPRRFVDAIDWDRGGPPLLAG